MHEARGPEAARPDDWGIGAYLPQTVGMADPQTEIEQIGKLARATGAGRAGPFRSVIRVGSALIAFAFLVLVVALLVS